MNEREGKRHHNVAEGQFPQQPPTKKQRGPESPAPWRNFLTYEQRGLILKYVASIASIVRERERGSVELESIPGALDLLVDAVIFFIGEIWHFCVGVSRIRIDVSVHELFADLIKDDLTPLYRFEALKTKDEKLRKVKFSAPFSSSQTAAGDTSSVERGVSEVGASPSSSVVGGRGRGRPRRQKRGSSLLDGIPGGDGIPEPTVIPSAAPSTAKSMASTSLFETEEKKEPSDALTMAKEKAREASLVHRKQAELSREISIHDILTALELVRSDEEAIIPLPPRVRRTFASLCAMYYETFMERVAAMQAQYKGHNQDPRRG